MSWLRPFRRERATQVALEVRCPEWLGLRIARLDERLWSPPLPGLFPGPLCRSMRKRR